MNRFWLIILRIICIIQILIATFLCFSSFADLLLNEVFTFLLRSFAFVFIAILPIITFNISNNYFPNRLIEGRQKKNFNRIFLINFLLLSFLFGLVFQGYKDYREAVKYSHVISVAARYRPPASYFLISFIISCAMLIFHFSILYGHYWMRRYINNNADRKQFDFEEENN